MRLHGICLITVNVPALTEFYRSILHAESEGDETSVCLRLPNGGSLDICSANGVESLAPGSTEGIGHGGFSLDIEVEDVDAEYERIREKVRIVKLPETYPWGRRSMWFRDPDGNLVNFFQTLSR
ncbi:VOC family protein [Gorillibacterium sp. sgz500922]|uniref:VOC family protein n=1 Tax=Gorillibacterium sp. sgz500922 TaxID=3446694 RepID=UPI003F665FED